MTHFTFLHAADLHLGSPLTGLAMKDEVVARRFATASREAFSELVAQAIAEKVAFVVFSGDIYDGDWKDTAIGLFFNREVSRFARADIPVFLIRGNHDAESEITKAVTLPDNVVAFPTRKADTHRLGRGFADRSATFFSQPLTPESSDTSEVIQRANSDWSDIYYPSTTSAWLRMTFSWNIVLRSSSDSADSI